MYCTRYEYCSEVGTCSVQFFSSMFLCSMLVFIFKSISFALLLFPFSFRSSERHTKREFCFHFVNRWFFFYFY